MINKELDMQTVVIVNVNDNGEYLKHLDMKSFHHTFTRDELDLAIYFPEQSGRLIAQKLGFKTEEKNPDLKALLERFYEKTSMVA